LYTMLELSRQFGNSPTSIYAYGVYGNIMSWLIPDIDFSYQLGQLAWLVLEQLDAQELKPKLSVAVSINITHWKKHTKETIGPLLQAIKSGLEIGDIEFACYAAHYYCLHLFFNANSLQNLQDTQRKYINLIRINKQEHQLSLSKILGQIIETLIVSTKRSK
jgi:predicted ATPase